MDANKVVKTYEKTCSIRETAKSLEMSAWKVKKILITEGIYDSDISTQISQLSKLYEPKEIMEMLDITPSCYWGNVPYTKTEYGDYNDNVSENALRIRKCRYNKKP